MTLAAPPPHQPRGRGPHRHRVQVPVPRGMPLRQETWLVSQPLQACSLLPSSTHTATSHYVLRILYSTHASTACSEDIASTALRSILAVCTSRSTSQPSARAGGLNGGRA